MDKQHLIGWGLAIIGIGLAIASRLLKMKPSTKQAVGGCGLALAVFGGVIIAYGLMSGTEPSETRMPISITQTNTNSPGAINATGDVTVNPEVNPNAPVTRYFFNGERWTTNPSVAIGGNLEEETPQKQAFQAMAKLEDAQNWSALKERCEAETKKTPEWLTPPLLCGKVYAVQGEIEKAIERVEYVQKKAAGREDYAVADRLRELIRQQSGK